MDLPFDGTWVVCNGGRDRVANVHPYAYDFVRPYRGTGATLEDYDAYGAAVLAPAAGVTCEVTDGYPDTPPGHEDAVGIPNVVVIDHGSGDRTAHRRLVARPGVRRWQSTGPLLA
jgi:hypothetical protein